MAALELDPQLIDPESFPDLERLVADDDRRTAKLDGMENERGQESRAAVDAAWARASPRLLEILQAKHGADVDALGKDVAALVTDEGPDQRAKRIERLRTDWTPTLEAALREQLDPLVARTLLTPQPDFGATLRSSGGPGTGLLPVLLASLWLLPSAPARSERQVLAAPFPLSSTEPADLTSASRPEGRIGVNFGASFGGAPRGRATLGHPFNVRPEDAHVTVEAHIAMPWQSAMASGLGPAQAYLGLALVITDGLTEVAGHERKLLELVSVAGFNEIRQEPGPEQHLICHFARAPDDTRTYLATVTLTGEATVVGFAAAYVFAEAHITAISVDSRLPD